jgi:hypothetical protein
MARGGLSTTDALMGSCDALPLPSDRSCGGPMRCPACPNSESLLEEPARSRNSTAGSAVRPSVPVIGASWRIALALTLVVATPVAVAAGVRVAVADALAAVVAIAIAWGGTARILIGGLNGV